MRRLDISVRIASITCSFGSFQIVQIAAHKCGGIHVARSARWIGRAKPGRRHKIVIETCSAEASRSCRPRSSAPFRRRPPAADFARTVKASAGGGLRPFARAIRARRRARPRQRRLSPGGAAEGALAVALFPLRKRHALRQPCRRRADGRHAYRRLVHAVPLRPEKLRRRRTCDREHVGRGIVQARRRIAGRLSFDFAPPGRRGDTRRAACRRRLGAQLHPRSGAPRVLFDLDTARRQLFARDGKSAEFDLVSRSLANLLRMWVED